MTKTKIAGGIAAIVFTVLAFVGNRVIERAVNPATDASPLITSTSPAAEASKSFIYGRVTTHDGTTYEGRIRFGGDEEAFWDHYLNGYKDENPWAALVPPERLAKERDPIEIFGFEIRLKARPVDLGRHFMVRFGDVKRIEARDLAVQVALKGNVELDPSVRLKLDSGIRYDPDIRVTLKSGAMFDLDRLSAGDFDDGVRIWDSRHGVVDLGPRQIHTIEFLPTPSVGDAPNRLYGTVHTRHGDFTGFLQWDRKEATGSDMLKGRAAEGDVSLRFDMIRSIARHSAKSSRVTLLDGSEIVVTDKRKDGNINRGIYVDDVRYGRVLVSWDAFEHVVFSRGGSSPSYDDFPPGHPLSGTVITRTGRRFTGRLVYDLDESEVTETLDAPIGGVDYTIPFGMVASIVLPNGDERASVTLQSGEELLLDRTGDLGKWNAGMLIFEEGRGHPEYVLWTDIEQIHFNRPPAMYPLVSDRGPQTADGGF